MKHQEGLRNTRPCRKTSLGLEGRLFRENRQGRETRLGRKTSLGFTGRFLRKCRLDRESKLNRDITLGWGGGRSRESRLGSETSLWWEGRLCREGWLGIAYLDGCIHQLNPTSSPLPQSSGCFLVLFEAS